MAVASTPVQPESMDNGLTFLFTGGMKIASYFQFHSLGSGVTLMYYYYTRHTFR